MKFNIYDYNNQPKEIDTGNKEIDIINVTVISGDEVITIYYTDGTSESFDSSEDRRINYFDDSYIIFQKDLSKWIKSANDTHGTISYNRNYQVIKND